MQKCSILVHFVLQFVVVMVMELLLFRLEFLVEVEMGLEIVHEAMSQFPQWVDSQFLQSQLEEIQQNHHQQLWPQEIEEIECSLLLQSLVFQSSSCPQQILHHA